jgi:hypothetical protein
MVLKQTMYGQSMSHNFSDDHIVYYHQMSKTIKNPFGCITTGNNLFVSECGGNQQEFIYDQKEIKANGKCAKVDPVTKLLFLADNDCDKWDYDGKKFKQSSNNNYCLNVNDDKILSIENCADKSSQYFSIGLDNKTFGIIRTNLIIPENTLPTAQFTQLFPGTIMLANTENKHITINKSELKTDSSEIQCLQNISKLIIGPLTSLSISFPTNQITFLNNSLEHDLIYDYTLLNKTSSLENITFKISKTNLIQMDSAKKVNSITLSLINGECMVTTKPYNNDLTMDSFEDIKKVSLTESDKFNILLGPWTMLKIKDVIFYNSSENTLVYQNITNLKLDNPEVNLASPINSGYAVFSSECNGSNNKVMALLGSYDKVVSNVDSTRTTGISENPLNKLASISSIDVGPYTKITMKSDDGVQKIYDNGSPHSSMFDLCKEGAKKNYDSIKIDLSDSYLGFGLVSLDEIEYGTELTQDDCLAITNSVAHKIHNADCLTSGMNTISFPQKDNKVSILYTCDSYKPSIKPESLLKKSNGLKLTSQDDFTMLDISCDNKAITSIKIDISPEGTMFYEYKCGQDLKDVMPYQSTQFDSIDSLFQSSLSCQTDLLTKIKISKLNDKYVYQYGCGKKVEGFAQDNTVKIEYFDNKNSYSRICPVNSEVKLKPKPFIITGYNLNVELLDPHNKKTLVECNGKHTINNIFLSMHVKEIQIENNFDYSIFPIILLIIILIFLFKKN